MHSTVRSNQPEYITRIIARGIFGKHCKKRSNPSVPGRCKNRDRNSFNGSYAAYRIGHLNSHLCDWAKSLLLLPLERLTDLIFRNHTAEQDQKLRQHEWQHSCVLYLRNIFNENVAYPTHVAVLLTASCMKIQPPVSAVPYLKLHKISYKYFEKIWTVFLHLQQC